MTINQKSNPGNLVKRKNWVLIAILIFLLSAIYSGYGFLKYILHVGESVIGEINDLKTFNSTFNGYSISIPSSWTHREIRNMNEISTSEIYLIGTFSSIKSTVNMYIYKSSSFDNLLNWNKDKYNNIPSMSNFVSCEMKIGNYQGILNEFSFEVSSATGNTIEHGYDWLVNEKDSYLFRIWVDDKYWEESKPLITKIIESINIY